MTDTIDTALALLNSMVLSGEEHSDTSRKIVADAMALRAKAGCTLDDDALTVAYLAGAHAAKPTVQEAAQIGAIETDGTDE